LKISRIITNLVLDGIIDGQVFEMVQNARYLNALITQKI